MRTSYWTGNSSEAAAGGTKRIGAPPPLTTAGAASTLEALRVELDRCVRGIYARVSARRLLVGTGMRRAVGAEEEFGVAARRGAHQRLAVLLALQDRQAVIMRPQTAREHRAAVVEQVVRGDRGGNTGPSRQHEIDSLAGGHVLDHDAKPRETAGDIGEDRLEEYAFPIENI